MIIEIYRDASIDVILTYAGDKKISDLLYKRMQKDLPYCEFLTNKPIVENLRISRIIYNNNIPVELNPYYASLICKL